jgi:hypothetical protein
VSGWSASPPGRFTPGERAPGTHWIGGRVDPRASLDHVEKRKFLTLQGFELRPLGRPASSQSLYRLCYPGSYKAIIYNSEREIMASQNSSSGSILQQQISQGKVNTEWVGVAIRLRFKNGMGSAQILAGHRLPRLSLFLWLSSVPPGKCRKWTSIRSRQVPTASLPSHLVNTKTHRTQHHTQDQHNPTYCEGTRPSLGLIATKHILYTSVRLTSLPPSVSRLSRPLTSLWASTACYRDSFTFTFSVLTLTRKHIRVIHMKHFLLSTGCLPIMAIIGHVKALILLLKHCCTWWNSILILLI